MNRKTQRIKHAVAFLCSPGVLFLLGIGCFLYVTQDGKPGRLEIWLRKLAKGSW
jgi:hypothetical protein